uniref:RedY protein n=1 Tax=Streptomyces griseoviridis TaxID=45398 RepID=B6VRQ0_STRGD|nr:hypothetical protein [Streptomyces griseoviridis]
MDTIVHRIRLRDGVPPERFERWVRETDYATCPELPSVLRFSVHRVPAAPPGAPYHSFEFFEIIEVSSQDAFARDMASDAFRRLEKDFDTMAEVTDELTGRRIGAGYAA